MADCTHTEHPPCARCRVEDWWEDYGISETMHCDDIDDVMDALIAKVDAHAAAAYERGRRKAFEEAAGVCRSHGADTLVAIFSQRRARVAEEQSSD